MTSGFISNPKYFYLDQSLDISRSTQQMLCNNKHCVIFEVFLVLSKRCFKNNKKD